MKLEEMAVELGFDLSDSNTSVGTQRVSRKGNRVMYIQVWLEWSEERQDDEELHYPQDESPMIVVDAAGNVLNVDEIRNNPHNWQH